LTSPLKRSRGLEKTKETELAAAGVLGIGVTLFAVLQMKAVAWAAGECRAVFVTPPGKFWKG